MANKIFDIGVEVNRTYDCFDDGKINPSRRSPVLITSIIPIMDIDRVTMEEWIDEKERCDWLYAKDTDYFIKGTLKVDEAVEHPVVFVRTLDNGWFGLGWWAGRLDVDGSLLKIMMEQYPECDINSYDY